MPWDDAASTLVADRGMRTVSASNANGFFKPSSMRALNHLLSSLQKQFEVFLVVSSTRRFNMPLTLSQLKSNNLNFCGKIDCTPLSLDLPRGKEINSYLKGKPNNQNYCIIDDEIKNIKPYVNASRIIQTSDQSALNIRQVNNFLSALNFGSSCNYNNPTF